MATCWICGTEYEGCAPRTGHCPKCGEPMPAGPTPGELLAEIQDELYGGIVDGMDEELLEDDKRETDTTIDDELREYDR